MRLKKLACILTLSFAGFGLTACGGSAPATSVASHYSDICVDSFGHVYQSAWCSDGLHPDYYMWHGYTHGHSYHTGQVIPRSYFRSGAKATTPTRATESHVSRSTASRASSSSAARPTQRATPRPQSNSGVRTAAPKPPAPAPKPPAPAPKPPTTRK